MNKLRLQQYHDRMKQYANTKPLKADYSWNGWKTSVHITELMELIDILLEEPSKRDKNGRFRR